MFNYDLVYDVGMHMGEDTAFYLAKGFRVIAFEAHPELIKHCEQRFSEEISSGRLYIEPGAVGPAKDGEEIAFFKSQLSVWGTTNRDWVSRNRDLGASCKAVQVPRVDLVSCLKQYGVPLYLKADIEGTDCHVLDCIQESGARPKYISIESEMSDYQDLLRELKRLFDLGYRKYKVVQQSRIPGSRISTVDLNGKRFDYVFEAHSSGSFGDEAPGNWLNIEEAAKAYKAVFLKYKFFGVNSTVQKLKMRGFKLAKVLPSAGWFDTHAMYCP